MQSNGNSSDVIKSVCKNILRDNDAHGGSFLDVGGGSGSFARAVEKHFLNVCLLDYEPREMSNIETRSVDLNERWPVGNGEFDVAVALEVIEHIENPRHFFRELVRAVKLGGLAVISTPNQISLASKLCFLLRSQHQHFQDNCYPAHISPLLPIDFERISDEFKISDYSFTWTDISRIPGTRFYFGRHIPWTKGRLFSDNVLFSFRVKKDLN